MLLLCCALSPVKKLALSAALVSGHFPAELDQYIARVLSDWKIPGIAAAVVRNDSVVAAQGWGVRELGKPEPVDEHTIFDMASLTKSFTATAAARLVDRGVLRWDDPVRRWLPGLVLPDSVSRPLTVRDFLSHRTGLEPANMMWVLTGVDRAEVLRRVRFLRVVVPVGREMTYSNVGYTVAGEAAAGAAGKPFEKLLQDELLTPLGLTRTIAGYEQAGRMPNLAAPHASLAGVQQPIARSGSRGSTAPAGAVQSSVSDIARWLRLHLNNGVLDGKRLVSDSAMREMHTIQVPIPTTPAMRAARLVEDSVVGYGLGWQIMDYRGHRLLWHTGNGSGQIVFMAMLPADRLGVVVAVNTWSAPLVHAAIMNRILDHYLGYPPRDWAAEAFPGQIRAEREQDSARRAMLAMRSSEPPPLPLTRYVGRYEHPLFGPLVVRLERSGLTLQMGAGRLADLEFHGGEAFFVRWRDPFVREFYGTHIFFAVDGDRVRSLRTRLNRDEFAAMRSPEG